MNRDMAKRISDLLLAKNGGNQSELARYVGVSPQAVQQWISGETSPRGKNLTKLAEFLGVTPARIQYGTENGGSVRPKAEEVVARMLETDGWEVEALNKKAAWCWSIGTSQMRPSRRRTACCVATTAR